MASESTCFVGLVGASESRSSLKTSSSSPLRPTLSYRVSSLSMVNELYTPPSTTASQQPSVIPRSPSIPKPPKVLYTPKKQIQYNSPSSVNQLYSAPTNVVEKLENISGRGHYNPPTPTAPAPTLTAPTPTPIAPTQTLVSQTPVTNTSVFSLYSAPGDSSVPLKIPPPPVFKKHPGPVRGSSSSISTLYGAANGVSYVETSPVAPAPSYSTEQVQVPTNKVAEPKKGSIKRSISMPNLFSSSNVELYAPPGASLKAKRPSYKPKEKFNSFHPSDISQLYGSQNDSGSIRSNLESLNDDPLVKLIQGGIKNTVTVFNGVLSGLGINKSKSA